MNGRVLLGGVGAAAAGGGVAGYRRLTRTPGPVTAVGFEAWERRADDRGLDGPAIELRTGRSTDRIRISGELFVGGSYNRATVDEIAYAAPADELTVAVSHRLPVRNLPRHVVSVSDAGRRDSYALAIDVERVPSTITARERPYSGPERTATIDR